jgi:hypothetical protein
MKIETRNPTQALCAPAFSKEDLQFRSLLRKLGVWPEAANRLFEHLAQTPQLATPTSIQDRQMLLMVARDALDQVDIAARYPALFRELLMKANLRRDFVQILQQLASRTGQPHRSPEGAWSLT